jgi:hypothetical protein
MKKSISVPMVTCFSKTRFFHQARKFFAWASLLAAFHLFACPLGWASGGWMTDGGVTGGDGLPTEADCRSCHEDLLKFPMLQEANVNKHHRLWAARLFWPLPRPKWSWVRYMNVSPAIPPSGMPNSRATRLPCTGTAWSATRLKRCPARRGCRAATGTTSWATAAVSAMNSADK